MSMTRFRYWRRKHVPPTFAAFWDAKQIGLVERLSQPPEGSPKWRATLDRDPLIEGFGRTRDAAVEDALQQVGGLG